MKVVAALGGNALLQRGEPPESDIQEAHVMKAVEALAPLARDHTLIVTHGNGPQVGLLALESTHDRALSRPYPLDVLGAQTQGMIGYWLVQAFQNALPGSTAACVISRTLVRTGDPAFANPEKFVGPVYDAARARKAGAAYGWDMRRDGDRWRRVVPSPEPVEVLDLTLIRHLAASGVIVICSGGGGVPVTRDDTGALHGVEAVVDKDLTAGLLAQQTDADALLLLTDVPAVLDAYGTPAASPLRQATPAQLRARSFPAGSMGPKVEAVCRFVELTGKMAAIGQLADAQALLDRKAGTVITGELVSAG